MSLRFLFFGGTAAVDFLDEFAAIGEDGDVDMELVTKRLLGFVVSVGPLVDFRFLPRGLSLVAGC